MVLFPLLFYFNLYLHACNRSLEIYSVLNKCFQGFQLAAPVKQNTRDSKILQLWKGNIYPMTLEMK
jgi:hypothetical protein